MSVGCERKADLIQKLQQHLSSLGFRAGKRGLLELPGTGKESIRSLHSAQRSGRINSNLSFIKSKLPPLNKYFASGNEIDPLRISPTLQRISSGTWEGDLFRLASLTWSVPVSTGFGRRMRYLVWDNHHGKLIGLIAIGDPVFNLSVRDQLIGWNSKQRGDRLVNIMDAYVLGAVPPYNMLLGGKLIACMVRSKNIYDDFAKQYGNTTGIISTEQKKARLLAVTTSSSMGRSSIYNRLKLDGVEYFKPIGFTGGWGHFHIPDELFLELRSYLRLAKHPYADDHQFGGGPNWRLRTIRAALSALGFKADLLRHGIQREVFISMLAQNAPQLFRTGEGIPNTDSLHSAEDVASLALERWVIPRSIRREDYKHWESNDIEASIFGSTPSRGLSHDHPTTTLQGG